MSRAMHRCVAILMAARNAEATIAKAIRTALTELETGEVIVIDDASSDGTAAAARAADDGTGRVRVRSLTQNLGPASARNLALAETGMPFVTVLDSDDYFLPGRLAQLVGFSTGHDMVADDLLRCREGVEDGRFGRLVGPALRRPTPIDFAGFVRANIPPRGGSRRELGFVKPLIRRSFLLEHGLGYDESLRLGEDFMLYARALAAGARFLLTPPCGYVAVERDTSLSHDHTLADLKSLARASDLLAGEIDGAENRKAMSAYRENLAHKIHYREILELRRQSGFWPAFRQIQPSHAGYVIGQSLGARIARLGTAA
jgi:succinoglycan biosynthesis protein ExoU